MKARILLVGAEGLASLLATENFDIELAADVKSGLSRAAQGGFDIIILHGAAAICDRFRRGGIDASILMLTEERVAGLRLGADDCVSGSCDPNELLARLEALLRRVPRVRRSSVTRLRFGDVEIDFGIPRATRDGRPISMTTKEFRLLEYLAGHRERVVSRGEILRNVWEYDSAVSSRTVDVHIGWLRQKLEHNPQEPKYIKTIRGRGYRFDYDSRSPDLLTLVNRR